MLASQAVKAAKDKRREAAERKEGKKKTMRVCNQDLKSPRENRRKKSKKLQNELNSQDEFDFDDNFDWLYDGKNENSSDSNPFRVKGPVPVDVFVEREQNASSLLVRIRVVKRRR